MSHYSPHNLRNDNDLIGVEWYPTKGAMVDRLRHMFNHGWSVRRHGLVSIDEEGNTVSAKPVRTKEGANGIAIWKISTDDEEVY